MKNLSSEQRYEMKMKFFSEISLRVLAIKLVVAIATMCASINWADEIANSINNNIVSSIVATSIVLVFSTLISLLFIKELNTMKKIEKALNI